FLKPHSTLRFSPFLLLRTRTPSQRNFSPCLLPGISRPARSSTQHSLLPFSKICLSVLFSQFSSQFSLSRFRRNSFTPSPPAYPVSLPSEPTTLWQGMIMGTGFL